eukprot:scaffold14012_cov88-Isochrysis_galbana.AAC.3
MRRKTSSPPAPPPPSSPPPPATEGEASVPPACSVSKLAVEFKFGYKPRLECADPVVASTEGRELRLKCSSAAAEDPAAAGSPAAQVSARWTRGPCSLPTSPGAAASPRAAHCSAKGRTEAGTETASVARITGSGRHRRLVWPTLIASHGLSLCASDARLGSDRRLSFR